MRQLTNLNPDILWEQACVSLAAPVPLVVHPLLLDFECLCEDTSLQDAPGEISLMWLTSNPRNTSSASPVGKECLSTVEFYLYQNHSLL